jgi:hypothetical protein
MHDTPSGTVSTGALRVQRYRGASISQSRIFCSSVL